MTVPAAAGPIRLPRSTHSVSPIHACVEVHTPSAACTESPVRFALTLHRRLLGEPSRTSWPPGFGTRTSLLPGGVSEPARSGTAATAQWRAEGGTGKQKRPRWPRAGQQRRFLLHLDLCNNGTANERGHAARRARGQPHRRRQGTVAVDADGSPLPTDSGVVDELLEVVASLYLRWQLPACAVRRDLRQRKGAGDVR